jgi:hypothetical protein
MKITIQTLINTKYGENIILTGHCHGGLIAGGHRESGQKDCQDGTVTVLSPPKLLATYTQDETKEERAARRAAKKAKKDAAKKVQLCLRTKTCHKLPHKLGKEGIRDKRRRPGADTVVSNSSGHNDTPTQTQRRTQIMPRKKRKSRKRGTVRKGLLRTNRCGFCNFNKEQCSHKNTQKRNRKARRNKSPKESAKMSKSR